MKTIIIIIVVIFIVGFTGWVIGYRSGYDKGYDNGCSITQIKCSHRIVGILNNRPKPKWIIKDTLVDSLYDTTKIIRGNK